MIFFNQDTLKNPASFAPLIAKEEKFIDSILLTQQGFKKIILTYMKKIAYSSDNMDLNYSQIITDFLDNLKSALNNCNESISLLEQTKKELNLISNFEISLETFNQNYSNTLSVVCKNTLFIEDFLYSLLAYSELKFLRDSNVNDLSQDYESITENDILKSTPKDTIEENYTLNPDVQNSIEKEENFNSTSQINTENSDILKQNINKKIDQLSNYIPENILNRENTLVVSETNGKVFSPYFIKDLVNIKKQNQDISYEEIVDKYYSKPLSFFKSPAISRFKETFKLVRSSDNKSIKYAFELSMELLFNYNIHPAIISACRNLDELDIYLDCLENNETEKFPCFKIVFEIAPVLYKKH